MNNRKILMLASLLLAACAADPLPEEPAPDAQAASRKIVNTSADAQRGTLLVCFDDAAVATLESGSARAVAARTPLTRSGIADVDAVLSDLGAVSLRRVFPCNPRTEERTRNAGLHKWYVVRFDADADLDRAAARLATAAEVGCVQFDSRLKKASVGRPIAYDAAKAAATRAAVRADAAGTALFDDPLLAEQWQYINRGDTKFATNVRAGADIDVEQAWRLTGGDPSIVVAIVDEGVKHTHPDLAANMWINPAEQSGAAGADDDANGYEDDLYGYNFAAGSGQLTWSEEHYTDGKYDGDDGHGTHVAGTVAAVNGNAAGVCGVAGGTGRGDGVKLMSCQIYSGGKGGTLGITAEAIKYAADNGASILQCSWGYGPGDFANDAAYGKSCSIERQAIDYFIATKNNDVLDGGLVIFAAGNDAKGQAVYPGAYRNYVAVTAFSADGLPAWYTNYGSGCNVAAPGGDEFVAASPECGLILSTLPSERYGSDYGYMQGTSMACPHVSGVAALGLAYARAKGRSYTVGEFVSMLLTSVNDIDTYLNGVKTAKGTMNLSSYRKKMGTGTIDAFQLLMQIEGTPCLKAKVGTSQTLSLDRFFGGASANLTYLGVEMAPEEMARLGLGEAPSIAYGKLRLRCTKPGVARIRVRAVAGGTALGSEDETGGMEIVKEFAVIARTVQTQNGGWL